MYFALWYENAVMAYVRNAGHNDRMCSDRHRRKFSFVSYVRERTRPILVPAARTVRLADFVINRVNEK